MYKAWDFKLDKLTARRSGKEVEEEEARWTGWWQAQREVRSWRRKEEKKVKITSRGKKDGVCVLYALDGEISTKL